MFQRFFDEGLAQSSYFVACSRTRRAAIVDPRRDVDVYVNAARQHGVTIDLAVETHIHADFVSGARELAARGATIVGGPGSQLQFEHREARDGEAFAIGDVTLEMLHTPGHTPEHISVLVREPQEPPRVLTGDTLFVGAVGRPDLLGSELTRRLAGELYESLFRKLLALDDAVEVHPGHGAGSLCGSGIGNEPSSTIGRERRHNPLLRHETKDAFVAAVLGDLPETPPYFARMKRINHDGPAVLDLGERVDAPPALPPTEAARLVERGAILLDVRSAEAFGAGHPAGALHIVFGPKVGYWAGWVVPPDVPLVLQVDETPHAALEVRRQLLRVGLDEVAGCVAGGLAAWKGAGLPIATMAQVAAADLRDDVRRRGLTIVDVRTAKEWEADHVDGAMHVPLGEIARRAGDIPRHGTVVTICEGGIRSSLAASLLARAGLPGVINVRDGMTGWRDVHAR